MLFALELGDKVVGVTDYCNYPPEASKKDSVGGFADPNIEVILTLEPDLVLAGSLHEETVDPAGRERYHCPGSGTTIRGTGI